MYGDQIGDEDARAQMNMCFERGVNFLDTAEIYTIPPKAETQGESERIVGRWVHERGIRDKVLLATKVAGRSLLPWIRDGAETRLTKEQVFTAIDRSLKNLQTDYIDLYQLHWPDRQVQLFGETLYGYKHYEEPGVEFEETLSALSDLQKQGKIRHFGVSNESPFGVMRMLALSETKTLPRVQSIQNCYNLLNRVFEYGLAEIALEEQVGLLAYSPIAQGALTGKYLDGRRPEGSRGEMFGRMSRYETPSAETSIQAYVDLAERFGLHPAALALQFVTTRPFVASNIFGANGEEQLNIVFQSLEIQWTDELEKEVNAIHSVTPNPCP